MFWALIGSFGTAFVHQKIGRDVQMGGLIGALVGAVGGIFFLMIFWVWLYYERGASPIRVYGKPRRQWYNWWN
jgi:hypothetical protein